MSFLLLDGEWYVDHKFSFSRVILEEIEETFQFSRSIFEQIEKTIEFSRQIYGTIQETFNFSRQLINLVNSSFYFSREIVRQVGTSKARLAFRKIARNIVFNSSGQSPLRGDVKRHRWWGTK